MGKAWKVKLRARHIEEIGIYNFRQNLQGIVWSSGCSRVGKRSRRGFYLERRGRNHGWRHKITQTEKV